jgi:alpha-glucosidase
MTAFEDGINAGRQAMDYRKKVSNITSKDKIKIKMVKNGGWVAAIKLK